MTQTIIVETDIHAPIETVWNAFTSPEAIKQWNSASSDWHTPDARNDLKAGGTFSYRMEAKDGSVGFDFTGTYDSVIPHELIAYTMEDGRKVEVSFSPADKVVHVTERFDPESENPLDMQQAGWQAILDNFKKYTESTQHLI